MSAEDAWPEDADGALLRRLVELGFDFTKTYAIDFSVDLPAPPTDAILYAIQAMVPDLTVMKAPDGYSGFYVRLVDRLSYEVVAETRETLTELTDGLGGACDTWRVSGESDDPSAR